MLEVLGSKSALSTFVEEQSKEEAAVNTWILAQLQDSKDEFFNFLLLNSPTVLWSVNSQNSD